MANKTEIEWTDSTWNPVTGCTKVGVGCDNCYAEKLAERFRGVNGHYFKDGFDIQLRPEKLDQPLRWKKPRRIFVNSMSDLFHKDIPDSYIDRVFAIMEAAHWHQFQVLTKRSSRMRDYLIRRYAPAMKMPNIWHGVSVENNLTRGRIEHIRDLPFGVKFISFEPLLGSLGNVNLRGIDWAIIGGESGAGARPMKDEWIEPIYDACRLSGTAFFFKQWGAHNAFGERVGKGKSGRLWRGKTWDDMPNY